MSSDALWTLETPDDFSFPFEPYLIQKDLMRHVFEAIEMRKVALVESPTGTGKSLSLICSVFTWLAAHRHRIQNATIEGLRASLAEKLAGEPRWVVDGELDRKRRELEREDAELEARIEKIRQIEEIARQRRVREANDARPAMKKRKLDQDIDHRGAGPTDDDFAPEDDVEPDELGEDGLSSATRDLLRRYHGRAAAVTEIEEEPDVTKVYYASRTHSQLSQFMGEIRKTAFKGARTVPLGSRANLCINDQVKKASGSVEDLNERCLDLQKKGRQRCPFLPAFDDPVPLNDFRDHALSSVHAIEDLEDLGRNRKVCPYYGARRSIRQAQLVVLPYQMLLSKTARDSLGVSLKDQIVVIDEAHALIDTILSTHTVAVTSSAIASALQGCLLYHQRFSARLKGINAANLKQLHAILSRLNRFCLEKKDAAEEMRTANSLVLSLGLDQVPLRRLEQWIKDAKIARKICGYAETLEQRQQAKLGGQSTSGRKAARAASISTFHRIQAFLLALTDAEKDGRIVVSVSETGAERIVTLKYLLLNAETTFREVVDEARAIILAGGTMAPMQDFEQQLFSYLSAHQITNLTCSHVVPEDHLLVRAIGTGPSGNRLELKYGARGDVKIMDELGQAIVNLASVVACGCVCFFPSYAFLDSALDRWKHQGLLDRLAKKKQIFVEPKVSGATDEILRAYATACCPGAQGGILFAVVGAKLSEGINFSDDLCRCVVVISIPYPSLASLELKERMSYITELAKGRNSDRAIDAGKILYSNLAFRAVNQAIGRAIRHQNDWAAIILLDARFSQPNAQQLLPGWIRKRLETAPSFGGALRDIATFMRSRR